MARSLWPVDLLHLAFFGLQLILQLVWLEETRGGIFWLLFDAAAIAGVFAVVLVSRRTGGRWPSLVRLVHGCLVIPPVFTQVGLLIEAMSRRDLAPVLEEIDRAMFLGANPLEAIEPLATPLLTEVMQWAYTAYLILPPATVLLLAFRANAAYVARSLFVILSVFYLSYLGYYLVPAAGPNIHNNFGPLLPTSVEPLPLYTFETPLDGLFATDMLRRWMFALELTKKDCFPSGHVAAAVVCLIQAWRLSHRAGLFFLPISLGVLLSTVYLRYHYVIDVIAGLGLALFCALALERWHRRREPVPLRAPAAARRRRTVATSHVRT